MNAKELRIGFYYMYNGSVFEMDRTTLSRILILGDEYEYEPIPLTEEWLIKFGFIKNTRFYRHPKTMWDYSLIDNELELFSGWDGDTYTVSCKYVHQLQNLYFALTGQELDTI